MLENKSEDRTLPSISDENWNTIDALRKKYNLSWNEVFHYFTIYKTKIDELFSLPREITKSTILGASTVLCFFESWMNNLRDNFATIQQSPDIAALPKTENGTALAIGAGPSIFDNVSKTNHLDVLAKHGFNGTIVTTDRMLGVCLEHGVIPDYVCFIDGKEELYDVVFNHDIIDEYMNDITALMCVTVHPKVVQRWQGKKYFFISDISQAILPNVAHTLSLLTRRTVINTGGNVGTACWFLAGYMGNTTIGLIGMDLAYKMSTPIEKSTYYQSFYNLHEGNMDKILKCYRKFTHPVFRTECYTDYVFDNYYESIMTWFKALKANVRTINATEGGIIYGDGVECMMFKDFLDL